MAIATEACAYSGCKNTNITRCTYVDRRKRECGYAWCPEHQMVVADQVFCRRHGGVMRAISAIPYEEIEPPDLDNRALSLTEWVAGDIDSDLRKLLESMREGEDAWVYAQPLSLMMQRSLGVRAWARGWTLANQTGVLRKVGIHVDEDDDATVIATTDGKEVSREIPPWISDRGTPISEDAVGRRRAEFRQRLLDGIGRALDKSSGAKLA
jgi:hypothetical protein